MGEFNESGMKFEFPDDNLFRIEKSRFYLNINDSKFILSFELYLSHFLDVNNLLPDETPERFICYDFSLKKRIVFVLIINCRNIDKNSIPDMISTIQNAFLKRFRGHKSIWGIDFIAIDHETAINRKLVKELTQ